MIHIHNSRRWFDIRESQVQSSTKSTKMAEIYVKNEPNREIIIDEEDGSVTVIEIDRVDVNVMADDKGADPEYPNQVSSALLSILIGDINDNERKCSLQ